MIPQMQYNLLKAAKIRQKNGQQPLSDNNLSITELESVQELVKIGYLRKYHGINKLLFNITKNGEKALKKMEIGV